MEHPDDDGGTVPQEWNSLLQWEERWAVLQRTYLRSRQFYAQVLGDPRESARQLLEDQLAQRLSLQEFTALAENLGHSWSGFLATWERLETALMRAVSPREAVGHYLADLIHALGYGVGLRYAVAEVRRLGQEEDSTLLECADLAEGFGFVELQTVQFTPEAWERWYRATETRGNY